MGAEGPFDLQAVDDLGSGPALRRVENDHRPARPRALALRACLVLDLPDLLHRLVERGRHGLMHNAWLVTFNEEGRPTAAAEVLLQFLMGDPGEDSGVRNLVAVEVQNRQYGTIGDGIQELVGMPRCREWPGFRLAIANHASHDQLRIVEDGAE